MVKRPHEPYPLARAIFLGGPGVTWQERPPDPRLAPWVATVWSLRCDIPQTVRILPDGCMDLIGDDLVGTLTAPLLAHLAQGDSSRGVRLRPGAFTALYGVPASELAGLQLPLADVVRPRPLLELAADADKPDPIASLALHATDVRTLARATGFSERHLRRRVFAATGHTPNTLRRIGRMQSTLAAGRGESWALSAVAAGYHDESPMINDIRTLAGATPRQLLHGRFLQDADNPSPSP